MLQYCPRELETLDRLRRLYVQRDQGIALACMRVPSRAVAEYAARHTDGFEEYPDPHERIAFWDAVLQERSAVHDDSIPSAYLSEMDQALYGALVGGAPRFLFDPARGWVSSMVAPILRDWSEFSAEFSTAHPWFKRYQRQLDVFRDAARGKFGISHFILIDGLNFVFELVGATETYLSLVDCPDKVRQAMALGFDVNLSVQNAFFERVPLVEGGTCSNFVQWIPGRIVSESVDPFHLTSVKYWETWGRENLDKMLAQFDGGIVHLHGNGRHLVDSVCAVQGLRALVLLDDEGFAPAFELLPSIKKRTGDLPLVVKVDYERLQSALQKHELMGGVLYQVQNVPDIASANRCADRVRAYTV